MKINTLSCHAISCLWFHLQNEDHKYFLRHARLRKDHQFGKQNQELRATEKGEKDEKACTHIDAC